MRCYPLSAIRHTLTAVAIRFVPHIYFPDVFLSLVNHDAQDNLLGIFLTQARGRSMLREVLKFPLKIIGGILAFIDNHSELEKCALMGLQSEIQRLRIFDVSALQEIQLA